MSIPDSQSRHEGDGPSQRSTAPDSQTHPETQTPAPGADEQAEEAKQQTAEGVESASEALHSAASTLYEEGQRTLAQNTSSLAQELSDWSKGLETKSVDELLQSATRLARRNPGLFIVGGIGAGVLLSRYFKASASTSQSPL